jgi:hypothetical protein
MSATVSRSAPVMSEQAPRATRATATTFAVALSVVALILSGISLGGWIQASGQLQQVQSRLVCLELPGPNDCGQDAE